MMKKVFKSLAVAAIGVSAGLVHHLSHTIYLDNYQNITQAYLHSVPIPVSLKVKKMMEEVMNDMKLDEVDRKQIRLFTCYGFGLSHAGSIWKHGFLGGYKQAIIGIPTNFNWETIGPNEKNNIVFKNEAIDWSSEAGQQLEKALQISNKTCKYALAQQVFCVCNCEPLVKGMISSVMALVTVLYVYKINRFKNLQNPKLRMFRYAFIFTSFLFNFTFWLIFQDIYKCYMEGKTDKETAALGKEYIEGGLEYFNNILKLNIALRNLGDESYTIFGNEKTLIRQPRLPLTERRDFFENLLKK